MLRLLRLSALLIICLCLLAGCKDLKSELEKRARANSLRKPSSQTTIGANGCPPGLEPRGKRDASGRPEYCESPKYDGKSVENIGENWSNGNPKIRYLLQGELLRVSRFYQNGNPQSVVHFLNNEKQGHATEWYPNRNLKAKGSYVGGKEHGSFERYWQTGKKKAAGTYRKGLKHGLWVSYAKTGQVKSRTEYHTDVRHGNTEVFDAKGIRMSHGSYERDLKSGRWISYYPDAKKKESGEYRQGKREGKWTRYFPTGKIQSISYFKEDRIVPKQTLRGEVAFRKGDILGAKPPTARGNAPRSQAKQSPRKRAPMTKGQGWKPL